MASQRPAERLEVESNAYGSRSDRDVAVPLIDVGRRTGAHAPDVARSSRTFSELHDRYRDDVLAYISRRVRDPHLAEDIAQETFLRAFRSAAAIDTDRPLWPWLQTIARNLISNTRRHDLRTRPHLVDVSELESEADTRSDGDPERSLWEQHRYEAIIDSLHTLSYRQRRMLLMRAIHGLSYEDIARSEGVSLDASKSLVKRARRSFREAYETRSESPSRS